MVASATTTRNKYRASASASQGALRPLRKRRWSSQLNWGGTRRSRSSRRRSFFMRKREPVGLLSQGFPVLWLSGGGDDRRCPLVTGSR